MRALRLCKRGSIAVETALIVPVVIIAVMITLYIILIIFQTCIMQSSANDIAERAAAMHCKGNVDFVSGRTSKVNVAELGLYRRWDFNSSVLQEALSKTSISELHKKSILKSSNTSVDIETNNNIINQEVNVILSCTYSNPLGNLTALWGLDEQIILRVKAKSTIDDPAEFIRNSDFILETTSKVPIIRDFEVKWQEIINRIIDYVDKISKENDAADG